MNIIFEFAGGSRDGRRDEGQQAANFYFLTDSGTVGKRFKGLTEHTVGLIGELGPQAFAERAGPARMEKYEVVERSEKSDEILVRCKFIEAV
jgi:hypothetical protein